MMKRWTVWLAAVLLALAAASMAQMSGPGAEAVRKFAEALNKADGVTANVTIQVVGGARRTVGVQLAKPNHARIDTPERLIVADGATLTFLDKRKNVYFTRQQTDAELGKVLEEQGMELFRPFFDARAVEAMFRTVRTEPSTMRRGVQYQVVNATLTGSPGRTMRLFLRTDDGIARVAELSSGTGSAAKVTVIDATTLTLGRPAGEGRFAFRAPADAKEIKESDLIAFRWYTDLEEAKTVAKASERMIMIDFWFDGCPACARLKQEVFSTLEFQAMSKHFVFVSIDMSAQPLVTRQFDVSAAPTIVFLNSEGTEVSREVGFRPLNEFLAMMRQVAGI